MNDAGKVVASADQLEMPVTIGTDAYLSADYAKAERDRLWRKSWLQAGRLEDIQGEGDFITFDIHDDSIIIVRETANSIRAFHNVCVHRGRRLVDTPEGQRQCARVCQKLHLRLSWLDIRAQWPVQTYPSLRGLAGQPDFGPNHAGWRAMRKLGRMGLDQYGRR